MLLGASKKVADNISEKEIAAGKHPSTLAGVAIYIISTLDGTGSPNLSEIATAVDMAEQTIRAACRDIREFIPDLIPTWHKPKIDVNSAFSQGLV